MFDVPYYSNSTISASIETPFTYKNAMEAEYLSRLGPALPGFRNSTPFRSSIFGTCEWPLITALNPAATGSRSSALMVIRIKGKKGILLTNHNCLV